MNLLKSSLWISSAKLGSSPHQKSQSSLRPGVWCLLQTLNTSAAKHRLKLHKIGSSSVTGKRIGEEVGPCHTKRRHFIPVKSALKRRIVMWECENEHREKLKSIKLISSCLLHNSSCILTEHTAVTSQPLLSLLKLLSIQLILFYLYSAKITTAVALGALYCKI